MFVGKREAVASKHLEVKDTQIHCPPASTTDTSCVRLFHAPNLVDTEKSAGFTKHHQGEAFPPCESDHGEDSLLTKLLTLRKHLVKQIHQG